MHVKVWEALLETQQLHRTFLPDLILRVLLVASCSVRSEALCS